MDTAALFPHLPPALYQALDDCLEPFDLPLECVLFQQGAPGDACYLVQAGRLCVIMRQPDGSETCLNELGPGEWVGEMALLTGQARVATVLAVQDSRLARLSKTDFDRLSQQHPELLIALADRLLPRIQTMQCRQILHQVFGPLDDAELSRIEPEIDWLRLGSGQVLLRQGEVGEHLYLVVQGRLRLTIEGDDCEPRVLGEVGAGESIGEFALLAEPGSPENRRSATVTATRLTDLAVLSRPLFEAILQRNPQALLNMTRKVIARQRTLGLARPPSSSRLTIALLPLHPGLAWERFTTQLAQALAALGLTLALDEARFDECFGRPGAAQTALEHPSSRVLDAWLDERQGQHQVTLLVASAPLDGESRLTPWARRCVEDADVLLLLAEGDRHPQPGALENALASAHSTARLELALLHPDDLSLPQHTAAWLEARDCATVPSSALSYESRTPPGRPLAAHHHLRLAHASDFRRLARRITGHAVGLALAGGGARGWAHIGAIQALEEAGAEIDWIAGSSMGAIIAGGYAMGWSPERMRDLAKTFGDPKKLLDYTLPISSLTATARISSMLEELCGGAHIEDTWRPFFCMSADLTARCERMHLRGPLWKAIRTSMAFPGIFAPILAEDGHILIDGGAANNLPIDHMRELCPTGTVIGVELVTSSPVDRPYDFGPSLSGWREALNRLNPRYHGLYAPTIVDVIAALVDSNTLYKLNQSRGCADLLIRVPVEEYGLLEFDRYMNIIQAGYQSASQQLKSWHPV
jgi:predicted acylesterase/phospholipase RssA/CRP-like cAMP-binding protein